MFNPNRKYLLYPALKLLGTLGLFLLASFLVIVSTAEAAGPYDNVGPVTVDFPDCITQTITVLDSFIVTDVNVGFNITTNNQGSVTATLKSPLQTVVKLTIGDFSNLANYDVLFDDSSVAPIGGVSDNVASPFYDRPVAPNQPLSAFNGQNASGTWTLYVCNTIALSTGTYNRAQLQFTGISSVGGTAEYVAVDTAKGYAGWLLVGASSLALVMGVVGGLWVWRSR